MLRRLHPIMAQHDPPIPEVTTVLIVFHFFHCREIVLFLFDASGRDWHARDCCKTTNGSPRGFG